MKIHRAGKMIIETLHYLSTFIIIILFITLTLSMLEITNDFLNPLLAGEGQRTGESSSQHAGETGAD